jgi:fimbrial isopeptide formation D2 family protein
LSQFVTGSLDPNDKTENHGGIIQPSELASGDFLLYTVRFQNTGTDTAFTVVIRDTLVDKLDWSSLQMVTASHKYDLSIKDNKCTWHFNNILLVDSNRNEPLSHGYLVYKIKAKPNVPVGDTIKNSASIYFDYNLPVQTNTEKTIVSSLVLPVTLISFDAQKEGKRNILTWRISGQRDLKIFEIERSVAGGFDKIGLVSAHTNNKFSFIDPNPSTSINHYRIKMVDYDGKHSYSPIRKVDNRSNFAVNIYPNPVKDNLILNISSDKGTTIQVEIAGIDGKTLISKSLTVQPGGTISTLNISHLSSGSYFLKIVNDKKEQETFQIKKLR